MAIAKIIKVKVNPNAAIDYVRNPDKTNERLLVSYDGCTESNIELCFKIALTNKIQNRKSEDVLAYHFIQSFAPTDEVTPKKAHELGMKFTEKTFGGKYSFICATHTDKGHIHNHFVMCAAERGMTRMRLDDNLSLLHTIQKNNDELCKTLRSSSNKTSVIEGVATLALYVIFVRRTRDLLTASFRFHLTMDTLAVRLYTSHYLGVFGTFTR